MNLPSGDRTPRSIVDVELGQDVRIGPMVNLYGCAIGDETVIGAFVEIQRGASIGARCKISSHSFVCDGVTIGDETFVGHGVLFVNDRHPAATRADGELKGAGDWTLERTVVGRRVSIGTGATVLCGITIGDGAVIGAGALVTRDVAPGDVVYGVPARPRPPREEQRASSDEVPLADVAGEQRELRGEILDAWARILDSGQLVSGVEVACLEDELSAAFRVDHAVALSSGTDALVLALRAAGVGAGDEVIVPTNTFVATAAAVVQCGATPVLVDCDELGGIDLHLVPSAVTARTRAVVAVHLYGVPADAAGLAAALGARIAVIEDAAQAHLASRHGAMAGGLGRAAAFSFYPSKNLGAPGEGGAVTTNDGELAARVRLLRNHGETERYVSSVVGTNARMSELVASTLRIKLRTLPERTARRRGAAEWYRERLAGDDGVRMLEVGGDIEPAWHLFPVFVAARDRIRARMQEAGIGTGVHYPVPVHLQPAFASLGHRRGAFPVAEAMADSVITLPMHASLTEAQVDRVCEALRRGIAS